MSDFVVGGPAGTVLVRAPGREVIATGNPKSIIVRDPVTTVVRTTVGERLVVKAPGPQGPAGPAGSGGGSSFTVQAGVNVSAYKLVVPRLVEGTVILADNRLIAHVDRPLWLALTAALTGETFTVTAQGTVTNAGWNWAQGSVFLDTDGGLTQTPPAAPAVFSAQVGHAVSPTSVHLERFIPVVLTA